MGKKILKTYFLGLIPFVPAILLAGAKSAHGDLSWHFNWVVIYLIISYLFIFPYVEIRIVRPDQTEMADIDLGSIGGTTIVSSTNSIPSPTINNKELGMQPRDPSVTFYRDKWYNLFCADFTIRLIMILFSPLFIGYYVIKQLLKKWFG